MWYTLLIETVIPYGINIIELFKKQGIFIKFIE